VRPWLLAGLLRPVFFGLAIAAAVITGDETGSFWLGLLAFLIAMATGKAVRHLIRRRHLAALRVAVWPVAAAGFAVLFVELGVPDWASALLAFLLAGIVRTALPREHRRERWLRIEDWGIPVAADVIEGRWARKED
jgi:biotin transporter BioY